MKFFFSHIYTGIYIPEVAILTGGGGDGGKWRSTVVLTCVSQSAEDVEHLLFKCLLEIGISISSFENVLLSSMAHFKNWVGSFLGVYALSSFWVFWTLTLPSVGCLFAGW